MSQGPLSRLTGLQRSPARSCPKRAGRGEGTARRTLNCPSLPPVAVLPVALLSVAAVTWAPPQTQYEVETFRTERCVRWKLHGVSRTVMTSNHPTRPAWCDSSPSSVYTLWTRPAHLSGTLVAGVTVVMSQCLCPGRLYVT